MAGKKRRSVGTRLESRKGLRQCSRFGIALAILSLVTVAVGSQRASALPPSGTGTGSTYCSGYSGGAASSYSFDNVYACDGSTTGSTTFDSPPANAYAWQCVELSARFLWAIDGIWAGPGSGVTDGADLVSHVHSANPSTSVGSPGPGSVPIPGDVISLGPGGGSDTANGHTAVVVASTPSSGSFTIMSENDPENSAAEQTLQVDLSGAHNGSVDFHSSWTSASWLETGTSPSPSISAVSPRSGYVGSQVTITGANLAGATSVSFNGATASIGSDTATQIVTSVPIKATTGSISVVTPSGTATYAFTVVRPTSWSLIGVTGNEEIYAIDSAGHTWEKWYSAGSGTWSDWFDLSMPTGQTLAGKPSVWISPVSGNEEVFARDTAGNYWEKWYSTNSGVWSPWTALGSPGTALTSDPAVIEGVTGNEDVYGIDSAGHAWEKWYSANSGTWSSWFDLSTPSGQALVGRPFVWASPVSGNEEVFARDTTGNYWEKWYSTNSGVWSPWTALGSPGTALTSDPAVIEGVTGNEDVYRVDSGGHAWEKWYSANSGTWSSWFDLGTPTGQTLVGRPFEWASPVSGNEEVFARDTAGNVWEKWYSSNSGVWSPWAGLGSPGAGLSSDPAVIEGVTGNEDVYGVDSGGHAWEKWYSANSGTWSGWFDLGKAIGPLTITTASPLPSGTKGAKYSATLTASGGTAPYSWKRISGKLPPGLKLNTHTGIISGKPRKRGAYSFTVSVTDQSAPAHGTATQLESVSIA